jgi:DNA-binding NtrC family response regulator
MDPKLLIYIIKEGKKNMATLKEEQDALWEALDCFEPLTLDENNNLPDEVDKFIIDKIKDALIECNNNRTHAAEKLGIKRETLLAKMRKYVIR